MVKDATPAALSGTDPRIVVPSCNVTRPVGTGVDPLTAAVKVTFAPAIAGLALVARATEVTD